MTASVAAGGRAFLERRCVISQWLNQGLPLPLRSAPARCDEAAEVRDGVESVFDMAANGCGEQT